MRHTIIRQRQPIQRQDIWQDQVCMIDIRRPVVQVVPVIMPVIWDIDKT